MHFFQEEEEEEAVVEEDSLHRKLAKVVRRSQRWNQAARLFSLDLFCPRKERRRIRVLVKMSKTWKNGEKVREKKKMDAQIQKGGKYLVLDW